MLRKATGGGDNASVSPPVPPFEEDNMKRFTKAMALFAVVAMTLTIVSVSSESSDAVAVGNWSEHAVTTWYDSTTPEESYTLTTAEELAGLATLVNEGNNFSGVTITLVNDIDLSAHEWTPIGKATCLFGSTLYLNSIRSFNGSLQGAENGITISGLTITTNPVDTQLTGLFGITDGATITDINLADVNISVSTFYAAGIVAYIQDATHITGCTVSGNISTDNSDKPSGTAGIVGMAVNREASEPNVISDCKNNASITGTKYVAGIVGLSSADVQRCINQGAISNMSASMYNSVGGIVGEQRFYGTISKCENYGTVSNNTGDYGTGGIVGWVRYALTSSNLHSTVTIEGCTNHSEGIVTSTGTFVGGVAGAVFHSVIMTGCVNDAAVTGKDFVGGIIGGTQAPDGYHDDTGCKYILTDNTNTGKLQATSSSPTNFGAITGQPLLMSSVESQDCPEPSEGSRWLVYNNTDSANEELNSGLGGYETIAIMEKDGQVFGYRTLAEAIGDVPADKSQVTIRLMNDSEISGTGVDLYAIVIPENVNILLDLNGHSATAAVSPDGRHYYVFRVFGTLTVTDNTEEQKGIIEGHCVEVSSGGLLTLQSGTLLANDDGGASVVNYGTFTMTGGTLKVVEGSDEASCLNNRETGVATITGGSFISPNWSVCNLGNLKVSKITFTTSNDHWNAIKIFDGVTTIDDCIFNLSFGGGIEVTSDVGNGLQDPEVTIKNSTFTQSNIGSVEPYNSMCVAASGGSSVTVENCTFDTKGYAFYVFNSGGSITVNGGTYTSTGDKGLLRADLATNTNDSSIMVMDGTFNGKLIDTDAGSGDEVRIQIAGGTFSDGFDQKYVVPGSGVFPNAEGRWGIFESVMITFQ